MREAGTPDLARPLRPAVEVDPTLLLALNAASEAETSPLDAAGLSALLDAARWAVAVGEGDALLIAMDQDSPYWSPNFLWFKERHERFAYVDRIIVAERARGRGLARRLYEHLFEAARRSGHARLTCEVNLQPPNPVSDAFHAALGFEEAGRAQILGGAKTVRYLEKRLA